jgi:hypothetical protein
MIGRHARRLNDVNITPADITAQLDTRLTICKLTHNRRSECSIQIRRNFFSKRPVRVPGENDHFRVHDATPKNERLMIEREKLHRDG